MADTAAPNRKLLRLNISGEAVATMADVDPQLKAGSYRRQSAPVPFDVCACRSAQGASVVSHTLVDCTEDAQNPLLGLEGAVDTFCVSKTFSLAESIALSGVPRARTLDKKCCSTLFAPLGWSLRGGTPILSFVDENFVALVTTKIPLATSCRWNVTRLVDQKYERGRPTTNAHSARRNELKFPTHLKRSVRYENSARRRVSSTRRFVADGSDFAVLVCQT
jgi:hypothetical protein